MPSGVARGWFPLVMIDMINPIQSQKCCFCLYLVWICYCLEVLVILSGLLRKSEKESMKDAAQYTGDEIECKIKVQPLFHMTRNNLVPLWPCYCWCTPFFITCISGFSSIMLTLLSWNLFGFFDTLLIIICWISLSSSLWEYLPQWVFL